MIKTDWHHKKSEKKKIGKNRKIQNSKIGNIVKFLCYKIWSKPGANERPKGEQDKLPIYSIKGFHYLQAIVIWNQIEQFCTHWNQSPWISDDRKSEIEERGWVNEVRNVTRSESSSTQWTQQKSPSAIRYQSDWNELLFLRQSFVNFIQ